MISLARAAVTTQLLMVGAMQEAGGPGERLAGQEPRRAGEDLSDDDVDVARRVASRQRRVHDLLEELHRERRHLLPPRTQVGARVPARRAYQKTMPCVVPQRDRTASTTSSQPGK